MEDEAAARKEGRERSGPGELSKLSLMGSDDDSPWPPPCHRGVRMN